MAQKSLEEVGYVVLADSDSVGLDQSFRSEVLPHYTDLLKDDVYVMPPAERRRVTGLITYRRCSDGSLELVQDYAQVVIPIWSGNGSAEPRIYSDGLPFMAQPAARRWLEGLGKIALPELQEPEGSIYVHYFETGRGDGKVVSGPHRDGELLVASFPDYINGEGAETTLYEPAPLPADAEQTPLEQVAAFKLGVGDLALSHDVKLWHNVSPLRPLADGSEPRRRSLIVNFNTSRTHRWIQDYYDSGDLSSAPAS